MSIQAFEVIQLRITKHCFCSVEEDMKRIFTSRTFVTQNNSPDFHNLLIQRKDFMSIQCLLRDTSNSKVSVCMLLHYTLMAYTPIHTHREMQTHFFTYSLTHKPLCDIALVTLWVRNTHAQTAVPC